MIPIRIPQIRAQGDENLSQLMVLTVGEGTALRAPPSSGTSGLAVQRELDGLLCRDNRNTTPRRGPAWPLKY